MTDPAAAPSERDRLPPMAHYVLGLLRRPTQPPPRTEREADELQERHLSHLRGLRESGELIAVGPILDDVPLRGVLVFRTDRVDRARDLMRSDPLVAAGYLLLELYAWYAPAGLAATEGATPTGLTFETD